MNNNTVKLSLTSKNDRKATVSLAALSKAGLLPANPKAYKTGDQLQLRIDGKKFVFRVNRSGRTAVCENTGLLDRRPRLGRPVGCKVTQVKEL